MGRRFPQGVTVTRRMQRLPRPTRLAPVGAQNGLVFINPFKESP